MNSAATVSLAILIMIIGISVSGQDTSDAARLKRIVIDYNQAEVIIDYPGYEKATALGKQFSVDKVIGGKLHIILSICTVNQFISLGIPFQIAPPPDESGIKGSSGISKAMTWQSYPSYTQYDSIMHKLAADYPDICRLQSIGTSVSGKQVYVLKISDNVLVEEPLEPEVFYSSTMHGDELAGYVLMLRLSEYLIKNYSTDGYVKSLVDNLQIYINPLANPDGTYPTGDAIINPTRFNANGIDLNRNFPDPLQPGIVQQKENADMIAFMRNHRFVLSANFHSGNEIVNYPWDRWLTKVHADNNWFVTLSRAYADTVHVYSHGDYMDGFDNGIVRGAVWYVITGGRQDFVTWELQGREVTIELDYTKLTPADSLEKMWEYNYRSLLNYLDYSRFGVNGKVTNKETGDPVYFYCRARQRQFAGNI